MPSWILWTLGMMEGDLMDISLVSVNDLRPAPWRATHVLKPDLAVIRESLWDYGWLFPLVVRASDGLIVDGHHRVYLAETDADLRSRDQGVVPVRVVECGEVDAMLMHVRLNRGRGEILAKYLSHIIKDVLASRLYSEVDVMKVLKMSADEMDILADGTLVKRKKIAEHKYSKGWVPVEAPANLQQQAAFIERPPNPDR